jgi:hypothetical protein
MEDDEIGWTCGMCWKKENAFRVLLRKTEGKKQVGST